MTAITHIPGWQTMSAAELLHQLGETIETRIASDSTREGTAYAGGQRIVRDFGAITYEQMLATLVAAGFPGVAGLLPSGIDFGDAETQTMLDQLATAAPSVFTAERVATMQSWGVTREPRWQTLGYESLPALEQVAAEQSRELAKIAITDRINSAKAAMSAAYDADKTGEQITAAAEAAWNA